MENQSQAINPFAKTKIYIGALLVLLALALAVLAWQIWYGSLRQPAEEPLLTAPTSQGPLSGQTFLPQGQLPQGITEDMILAEDAEIMESYEYTDSEKGIKQSSLKYTTKLSLETIKRLYLLYLSKNPWALITNFTNDNTINFSFMTNEVVYDNILNITALNRNKQVFNILATIDQQTGSVNVELTIITGVND